MNTKINELERKINELVMRMNNAENSLKQNATNEIISLRNQLNDLKNQFDELKIQMLSENSDEKITEELIEDLIKVIDSYISSKGRKYFRDETFNENNIESCDLRINYSMQIELEQCAINVEDYFIRNFNFHYDDFIKFVNEDDEYKDLIKFLPEELFDLIHEIVEQSVRDIDTSPTFNNQEDFELEINNSKRVDVTEITIIASDLEDLFNNDFEFNEDDICSTIKQYHNFSDTYSSDDNSDDNSDEN